MKHVSRITKSMPVKALDTSGKPCDAIKETLDKPCETQS
jgi:hypothetical protein